MSSQAATQEFVVRQNIEHFHHLLQSAHDAEERRIILDLLGEEEHKLKKIRSDREGAKISS